MEIDSIVTLDRNSLAFFSIHGDLYCEDTRYLGYSYAQRSPGWPWV